MDLSIIIPCYNLENYIEKCMNSILQQRFENLRCELIFICDSCTDSTKEKIIEQLDIFSHIENWTSSIYIRNYRSAGLARNLGLDVAIGEYIWFIDGDDWLPNNNAIQIIMDEFKKEPSYDMVRFNYTSQGYKWESEVMLWQYVFKKDFIGSLRFLDIMPKEDDFFTKDIYLKQPKVKKIAYTLYYYNHPRVGSTMDQVFKNKWKPIDWKKENS